MVTSGGLMVAVAVCSRNRPQHLSRLFPCLQAQTYPISQLILVEDTHESHSFSLSKLKKLFPNSTCVYKKVANKTIPFSRNIVLESAKADIVIFVDDDVYFDYDLIARVVSQFEKRQQLDACFGLVAPALKNLWSSFSFYYYHNTVRWAKRPTKVVTFPLSLAAIKLKAVKELKLQFDEQLPTGEDIDFFLSWHKRGGTFYFFPSIRCYHNYVVNLWNFLHKHWSYAKNFLYLSQKHPGAYSLLTRFPRHKYEYLLLPLFVVLWSLKAARRICKELRISAVYIVPAFLSLLVSYCAVYSSPGGKKILVAGLQKKET